MAEQSTESSRKLCPKPLADRATWNGQLVVTYLGQSKQLMRGIIGYETEHEAERLTMTDKQFFRVFSNADLGRLGKRNFCKMRLGRMQDEINFWQAPNHWLKLSAAMALTFRGLEAQIGIMIDTSRSNNPGLRVLSQQLLIAEQARCHESIV